MLRKILLLALCIQLSIFSNAQAPFTSPYKLSLAVDIPLGTNAIGLLGTSYLLGTTHSLPSQESILKLDRNSINKFDRGATYQNSKTCGYISDATMYAAIALPLLHLINPNSRKDFGKIAVMTAEVFALNIAVTNLFKETIHRPRPLVYNPDVPMAKKLKKDNFKSFFSGHTSTVSSMSFFFAATYATYNPNSKLKPVVWSLCAALPILTGVLRYKAGKHYWTDVITGYLVGAAIGVAVPYLHSVKWKFNQK